MKNELNRVELNELHECEATIERTSKAFVECGIALERIRSKKLYRQDFDTFEEYCQTKWGWNRQHAHRIIQAAQVKESMKMSPMGDKIENERQARALAEAFPEDREEVLNEASKSGKVTSKSIQDAIKTVKNKQAIVELDKTGYVIPEPIVELFVRGLDEVQNLLSSISRVRSFLKKAQEDDDVLYREVNFSGALSHLDNSYRSLKSAMPFAVCTSCQGHNPSKCSLCKGRGFISEFLWDTCAPVEVKKIRSKALAKNKK